MDLTPDRAALAVERHDCPNCDAPAGSAWRTCGGKTAAKYHTPRFVLVPALREELEVLVPVDRHPGHAWKQGPALVVSNASGNHIHGRTPSPAQQRGDAC
ncbi:zinc finger domain-containing protein [Streptomyces abikoensis]|uniref:zinc finger domain-containing protein n=1 Tax=Streptomyces abikoensis TaxID=97398 RepID=UPI003403EBF6